EVHAILADGERHTPLTAVLPGDAGDAVLEGEAHRARCAVDDGVLHLAPELRRTGEEADVGGGVLWVEAGNEDRGAQGGGEARGVVGEGLAGWRRPGAWELQGIAAGDEGPAALAAEADPPAGCA